MKVTAIIAAAGKGKRFGGPINKQFIKVHHKTILQHTVEKYETSAMVHEIVIVTAIEHVKALQTNSQLNQLSKISGIIAGGAERQESVWNGLQYIDKSTDIVLIHDGVRPCFSHDLIYRSVEACKKHNAVIAGIVPKDTIKEKQHNYVKQTYDRSNLVAVQTPQAFQYDLIYYAYKKGLSQGFSTTDDSMMVENLGHPVFIIEGEYKNIKITSPEDLILAREFLKGMT